MNLLARCNSYLLNGEIKQDLENMQKLLENIMKKWQKKL